MALRRALLACLSAALLCTACGAGRGVELIGPDGGVTRITRATLRPWETFYDEDEGIPLEHPLYEAGYRVIETLTVTGADGITTHYDWHTVAEGARWLGPAEVEIDGAAFRVARIEATELPGLDEIDATLSDIAPTIAAAMGFAAPSSATGQPLSPTGWEGGVAERTLMLFLDGFGYVRYVEAWYAGTIPALSRLGEPLLGLSAYVPCTQVGSAAVLTGAPPEINGVGTRRVRTTASQTLFDAASAAGLRGVAVEGDVLSFNLRSAEIRLSADADDNGSTDDNVLANALAVLDEGQPELLWVHFHGIDDASHTYGPGAPEEVAAVAGVDAAVGMLLERAEPGTLVVIFADHGQHTVEGDDSKLGNHGSLIERDMLVPIWAFVVE